MPPISVYAAAMSGGLLALIMHEVDPPFAWPSTRLPVVGLAVWFINTTFFIACAFADCLSFLLHCLSSPSGARAAHTKEIVKRFIRSKECDVFGTAPMALSAVLQGAIIYYHEYVTPSDGHFIMFIVFWIVNLFVSLVAPTMVLMRALIHGDAANEKKIPSISPRLFLNCVPPQAAAMVGASLRRWPALADERADFLWLISYSMWGASAVVCLLILCSLFSRLYSRVPAARDCGHWLITLGPVGYSIIVLTTLGVYEPGTGQGINAGQEYPIPLCMTIWGIGLFWSLICLLLWFFPRPERLTVGRLVTLSNGWPLVFPLGIWAASTVKIGKITGNALFQYLGFLLFLEFVVHYLSILAVKTIATVRPLMAKKRAGEARQEKERHAHDNLVELERA